MTDDQESPFLPSPRNVATTAKTFICRESIGMPQVTGVVGGKQPLPSRPPATPDALLGGIWHKVRPQYFTSTRLNFPVAPCNDACRACLSVTASIHVFPSYSPQQTSPTIHLSTLFLLNTQYTYTA